MKQRISILTTAHNEDENIIPFYNSIKNSLKALNYEIIFVNDGSTDKTLEKIRNIKDKRIKIIDLKKRKGKAFALYTGLKNAKNNIIATIDSDLQSNPKDILKLLKELNKDYDLACGWRYERKDNLVKKVSSKIGNFVNNKILKVNLQDNNCPLRVFKKKCIKKIKFFESFHRFIPVLVKMQGYKISEVKIKHYPRLYGKSKYGVHNRIIGNLKTLFMVKFKSDKLLDN